MDKLGQKPTKAKFVVSRELRPKKYVGSFGTVGETQEPYETDEKMEMAKQDTTKTSFFDAIRLEDQHYGDKHRTKTRRRL